MSCNYPEVPKSEVVIILSTLFMTFSKEAQLKDSTSMGTPPLWKKQMSLQWPVGNTADYRSEDSRFGSWMIQQDTFFDSHGTRYEQSSRTASWINLEHTQLLPMPKLAQKVEWSTLDSPLFVLTKLF